MSLVLVLVGQLMREGKKDVLSENYKVIYNGYTLSMTYVLYVLETVQV